CAPSQTGRRHRSAGGGFDFGLGPQSGSSVESGEGQIVMNPRISPDLPPVRGTYMENAPLKDLVWFRAGGEAEILFRPADANDLAAFLSAKPEGLPVS